MTIARIGALFCALQVLSCSSTPKIEDRQIARDSVTSETCWLDTFTSERLTTEIQRLEQEFEPWTSLTRKEKTYYLQDAQVLQKNWHGISYEKFSTPQATFLKNYGYWVHFDTVKSPQCNNLICILNIAYGDTARDEGLLIYHFFLKMGYGISTRFEVPENSVGKKPHSDFLFTTEELMAFWVVSEILPEKYRRMFSLKTIHRWPGGSLGGGNTGGGIAQWGFYRTREHQRHAAILVSPTQMVKSNQSLVTYFYGYVIHEMTHALDIAFNPDAVNPVSSSVSYMSAYRRDGRVSNICNSSDEDFAESVMYSMVRPDIALTKAPLKYDYVVSQILGGRYWDQNSLSKKYSDLILQSGQGLNGESKLEAYRARVDDLKKSELPACKFFNSPLGFALKTSLQF